MDIPLSFEAEFSLLLAANDFTPESFRGAEDSGSVTLATRRFLNITTTTTATMTTTTNNPPTPPAIIPNELLELVEVCKALSDPSLFSFF